MKKSENEKIYVQALVTFIDVLGFKEMIGNDSGGGVVREVLSQLRGFGTMDLDERAHFGFSAYGFSDSVTRCTPLLHQEGLKTDSELLAAEIEELTYIQGELSAKGILIRGGIACGDIYMDEHEVFGPAFIDAYILESKHARYPRIIVHPNLLKTHATFGESGYGIYAEDKLRLTREDTDGFHFVDYLGNFPREIHFDPPPYREETILSYMEPRKQKIEEDIKNANILGTVRPKHVWLGKYHDTTAKELLGEQASSVLINTH